MSEEVPRAGSPDSSPTYDVVVIGSGPGGYVAAIRAAQLKLKTACIERAELGGICLNWGCIPTKALLRTAELLETMHHAKDFGILVENIKPDFPAIIARSRGIAEKVSKGIGFLFRKNKIDSIAGLGKLLPRSGAWKPHQIEVTSGDGAKRIVSAKHVIIATGARARSLPGIELDDKLIVEYRRAMTLPQQPKSMVVLGAGAIGVEFASFYRALGTEVTIVEFLPRLVPNEDPEISKELLRAFDKRGIKSLVDHKLTSAKVDPRGGKVVMSAEPKAGGTAVALEAEILLVAVGIAANTENLGLEAHGIQVEKGWLKVDADNKCGDGLWAIGDVIGRGLAHVASAEGVFVAEKIAGVHAERVRYDAIPACTYCSPEIASVGLTEEKAKAQNIPVKVGKFPFSALAKARAAGDTTGFVKTLWHAETGALVGAHLIGPAVTDLIAELTLAKTTEVNADSLLSTIHAHPTFAETIKGATEAAFGQAIDL
jgi:dihydrolipoamide dehydrogenase